MAQEGGESPKLCPQTQGPPSLPAPLSVWMSRRTSQVSAAFQAMPRYRRPLVCSSWGHRANGLGSKKLLLHQHLVHIVLWKMKERDCPRGHAAMSLCFWSTLLLASTLCRHSEFSFDKKYEIIFSLSLCDIAKVSFPILHLDWQFYQTNPSFTQSTAGNHYFFKQSSPSLSVCEQKHAAIFLELLKGASSSSFLSERKVKVRIGVISFCLDVFKFKIIMFPQQTHGFLKCACIVQTQAYVQF